MTCSSRILTVPHPATAAKRLPSRRMSAKSGQCITESSRNSVRAARSGVPSASFAKGGHKSKDAAVIRRLGRVIRRHRTSPTSGDRTLSSTPAVRPT